MSLVLLLYRNEAHKGKEIMANSKITHQNPAISLLNTVISKAARKVSRRDLNIVVGEYGDYLNVLECDKRLIVDAITETPRKSMVEVLEEVRDWYCKLDQISAQ